MGMSDQCEALHPVKALRWRCILPAGHDGLHKADPPTVTPTEIATELQRETTTTPKDWLPYLGMLPSTEST